LTIVAHLAVGNGLRFAGLFAKGHDRVGVRLAQQVILDQLFRPVKPSLAYLKDAHSSIFLTNLDLFLLTRKPDKNITIRSIARADRIKKRKVLLKVMPA
jgi:hypothetical protein